MPDLDAKDAVVVAPTSDTDDDSVLLLGKDEEESDDSDYASSRGFKALRVSAAADSSPSNHKKNWLSTTKKSELPRGSYLSSTHRLMFEWGEWIELDRCDIDCARCMMKDSDCISATTEILHNFLLSGGVTIKENSPIYTDKETTKAFMRFWAKAAPKFFGDVLRQILVYGLVIYSYAPSDEWVGAPKVLELDALRVWVRFNSSNQLDLRAMPRMNAAQEVFPSFLGSVGSMFTPDNEITKINMNGLLFHVERAPDRVTGHLNSIILECKALYLIEKLLFELQEKVSRFNSDPPVLLVRRDDECRTDEIVNPVILGRVLNQVSSHARAESRKHWKKGTPGDDDEEAKAAVIQCMSALTRNMGMEATFRDPSKAPAPEPSIPVKPVARFQKIPDDRKIEDYTHPEQALPLAEVLNMIDERFAIKLGIPRKSWTDTSSTKKSKIVLAGSDDSTDRVMNATFDRWKRILTHLGESVFTLIHHETLAEKTAKASEGEGDMATAASKQGVEFSINGVTNMQAIDALLEKGMMKFEVYRKYAAAIKCIPIDDISQDVDEKFAHTVAGLTEPPEPPGGATAAKKKPAKKRKRTSAADRS